ncbi:hypothetical protein CDAR_509561 [Caerostris darwini]|uniref:Uncharacterized protein n=1 Tax=Caerostris darwini TaxID=1538125 RepID=A0AAV4PYL9_9ARAC|nr:hypothetical protein CDAR_509561 [Caerostris darwini]
MPESLSTIAYKKTSNISFITKGRKLDLVILAAELGEKDGGDLRVIDLWGLIKKFPANIEFMKNVLDNIIAERLNVKALMAEWLALWCSVPQVSGSNSGVAMGVCSGSESILNHKECWFAYLLNVLPNSIVQLIAGEAEDKVQKTTKLRFKLTMSYSQPFTT